LRMYPSRNDQKQKSHGFRGFSRISYTWRHKCATEIDNQSAAAGPDSIEYSPQRHGEHRGAMPIFMPGDQRFAFRHSRPGTAEKPCRKGMKSHAGAAFPPFPGVNGGRRRPRAGLGQLGVLCVSVVRFSLFPCALRSQQRLGLMSLCICTTVLSLAADVSPGLTSSAAAAAGCWQIFPPAPAPVPRGSTAPFPGSTQAFEASAFRLLPGRRGPAFRTARCVVRRRRQST